MTRGMNYLNMPEWTQDLASIPGMTLDQSPDERPKGSIYKFRYENSEFLLKESEGSVDEIAEFLSGNIDQFREVVEDTDYEFDERDYTRAVLKY